MPQRTSVDGLSKAQRAACGGYLGHVKACAAAFDLGAGILLGPSRSDRAVMARRAAIVVLRGEGLSLPAIGRIIGRHHTTVLNALRRAGDATESDPRFRAVVEGLRTHFEVRPAIRAETGGAPMPKYQDATVITSEPAP